MKDLYQRLNIQRQSSDSEDIRMAIATCPDDGIAQAAEHILLEPKRRQYYDMHHRLLTTIGQIRANLNVPESSAWNALQVEEFDLAVDHTNQHTPFADLTDMLGDVGMMDEEATGYSGSTVVDGGPMRSGPGTVDWAKFALAGIFVAVLGIVIVTFVTLLGGSNAELPAHGHVERYVDWPADCSIQITNSNSQRGNVFVEFFESETEQRVMSVLVREGLDTSVNIPSGNFEVRFSVGDGKQWNEAGFDQPLRYINPRNLQMLKGRKVKLPIPDSKDSSSLIR